MKLSDLFSKPKTTQEIRASGIRFLNEQDGQNERLLKQSLFPLLSKNSSVDLAYLVRTEYEKPKEQGVALCLVTTPGPDKGLIEEVHQLFRKMAPRGAKLDIMFPSSSQRLEIDAVAKPFYRRS